MLVMAAFLVMSSSRIAPAEPRAGEILALRGQCFVEADGQRRLLKLGDAVHVGDTVYVPENAKLKVRMNDGSVFAMASGSRIAIKTYQEGAGKGRDAEVSLVAGLLRAVVSATAQLSRFEVDTATAVAAVRSTDWFMEARPDSTQVGVLAGIVRLTSHATGRWIDIPARWGARVEFGRDPVPARVWSRTEFDDVIGRTDLE